MGTNADRGTFVSPTPNHGTGICTVALGSPNMYSEVDVPTGRDTHVDLRASSSGQTWYMCTLTFESKLVVERCNNGIFTTVGSAFQCSTTSRPGRLRAEIDGSTIKMTWGGQTHTVTDTNIQSGEYAGAGIYMGNLFSFYLDNWTADSLVKPPSPIKIGNFSENFPGSAINTGIWGSNGGVTVANNVATFQQTAAYYAITSNATYDWLDSSLFFKLEDSQNLSTSTREAGCEAWFNDDNKVLIYHSVNRLMAAVRSGGVYQANPFDIPYDPVQHAYLRMRCLTDKRWAFDTSPDGRTWTQRGVSASAVGWDVRNTKINIWTGFWGTDTGTHTSKFSRINVTGAAMVLAGSLRPTGALQRVQPPKRLSGSVAAAGTFLKQKVAWRTFAGSSSPVGTFAKTGLLRKTATIATYALTSKRGWKMPRGSVAPGSGTVRRTPIRRFPSTIALHSLFTPIKLGRILGRAGSAIITFTASVGEIRLRFRRH
jgi:hypothetical protein